MDEVSFSGVKLAMFSKVWLLPSKLNVASTLTASHDATQFCNG